MYTLKKTLFNILTKSVLLYGCETWKVNKSYNNNTIYISLLCQYCSSLLAVCYWYVWEMSVCSGNERGTGLSIPTVSRNTGTRSVRGSFCDELARAAQLNQLQNVQIVHGRKQQLIRSVWCTRMNCKLNQFLFVCITSRSTIRSTCSVELHFNHAGFGCSLSNAISSAVS